MDQLTEIVVVGHLRTRTPSSSRTLIGRPARPSWSSVRVAELERTLAAEAGTPTGSAEAGTTESGTASEPEGPTDEPGDEPGAGTDPKA